MFAEGILVMSDLNVNNYAASLVNYSSNIDHVTESNLMTTSLIQTRFDVSTESAEL